MTKHTKGPWEIGTGSQPTDSPLCAIIAENLVIARTYGFDPAVMRSDARLISAAPELLDACKLTIEAHGSCDGRGCFCEAIKAAIRKAEGTS